MSFTVLGCPTLSSGPRRVVLVLIPTVVNPLLTGRNIVVSLFCGRNRDRATHGGSGQVLVYRRSSKLALAEGGVIWCNLGVRRIGRRAEKLSCDPRLWVNWVMTGVIRHDDAYFARSLCTRTSRGKVENDRRLCTRTSRGEVENDRRHGMGVVGGSVVFHLHPASSSIKRDDGTGILSILLWKSHSVVPDATQLSKKGCGGSIVM